MGFKIRDVARSVPFDNSTNGFESSNVQAAIEEMLTFNPQLVPHANFDDFDNRMSWSPSTTGAGASASVSLGNATYASGKHIGVARVATGTPIGTAAALQWSATLANSIVVGDGEAEYQALVYLPILSTVANNYTVRIGLGTSATADHADGIYFEYSAGDTHWLIKTASNSTRTTTTTTITVNATTWTHLKWVCNSAGTSVEFFVDGVTAGTITTNIPTTTGRGCGGNFQITNTTVLAAAREMLIDYFYFSKMFTARN